MKIEKGTIVRTFSLLLVFVNLVLRNLGYDPLHISQNEIAMFVECGIEGAVIFVSWWYNNSFSKNALKAQAFLNELRKEDKNV